MNGKALFPQEGTTFVEHVFLDSSRPAYPIVLGGGDHEVVRTTVRVRARGTTTRQDIIEFTHFVKRVQS